MTYTRDTKNFDAESFQKDLLDNLSIIGNGCGEEDENSLMRNFINIFNDTQMHPCANKLGKRES